MRIDPEQSSPTGAGRLVLALVEATARWAARERHDGTELGRLRDHLISLNHERYVRDVPAYRALARDTGLAGPASVAAITTALVLDEGFFKSYDPQWLDGDFDPLTEWLDAVGTTRLARLAPSPADRVAWREQLKQRAGIAVTFSSGTAGRPSLVPRDRATLALLRASGGVRLPWADLPIPHDALFLVAAGQGSGIQSGASGLATGARRARFAAPGEDDWDASLGFLRRSIRDGVPALVYGPPAALATLLDRAAADPASGPGGCPLPLPAGSVVVTGGGWKRSLARDPEEIAERVTATFGVGADRVVDTYSTAELNTVLLRCRHGRYHVPPVLAAVVLDELMQPKPLPARGLLAFLDPLALSYPGYIATGDQGLLVDDPCPCGLSGITVAGGISRTASAAERGCGVLAGSG